MNNGFSVSWALYQSIMFGWIVLAVLVFFILLKVTAPYGRHSSPKWGPQISNSRGWFLMEIPVLIVLGIFILPAVHTITTVSLIMIGLFCLHYFNRVFIFPFRIHTKGKKIQY